MKSARELIISLLFVAVAATALAFAIVDYGRAESASESVVSVIALENALNQSLTDVKNYQSEALKLELRSGHLPSALVFRFSVKTPSGDHAVEIHPNETVMLDRDFQVCKTYPIGDCGYKIKLSLDLHPPAFSYSVASSFAEGAISLDRSERTAVQIPKSYFRDSTVAACDLRHELGLTGLQSSDKYDCLSRPVTKCPRGSLPKSLVVDSKTHSLELECGPQSRVVRCPAFYALSHVNTKTLDPRAGQISVQCVRTTASVAMPQKQPAPTTRLAGRVCPTGYKSDSLCAIVNVQSKPGKCGTAITQPVAGKIHFTQNKTQGYADCGLDLPPQSCGAVWFAQAQLTIRCVLDQPEFANAL